jgi:hypothetical protein
MAKFLVEMSDIQTEDGFFEPATAWNLAKKEVGGGSFKSETSMHSPEMLEWIMVTVLRYAGAKSVTVKFVEGHRKSHTASKRATTIGRSPPTNG